MLIDWDACLSLLPLDMRVHWCRWHSCMRTVPPQAEGVRSAGQTPPSCLLNREVQDLRYICWSEQILAWCALIKAVCVTVFSFSKKKPYL